MAERSSDPKSLDLGKLLDPKRVKFEIKTPEDPAERDHRLRKEFLSFLIKDLSAYVIAVLIIIVVLIYCFVALVIRNSSPQERGWAMSVLASILTGAVGFAFGKSSK
jgi:uncharacterized RDD family membrane protein YckC